MTISLEQVKEIFPEHLCLEISELELQKAKSLAAQYTDLVVRDRVFLNSLCLEIILPTIADIFDLQSSSINSQKIKRQHQEVWQSLHGVAIDLPQVRLVLMPTEDFDTEELRVKQEWLNDPNLNGDIYLAVQVSLEERWLRVWGFTSHQELHEQGIYDVSDGSYAIDRSDLWMSLEAIPAIVKQKLIPLRSVVSVAPKEVALTQSLSQKIFSRIWQPWDELVASLNMNLVIVRQNRFQGHWGRKINLDLNIADYSFVVTIGFQKEEDNRYFIQVRLYPDKEQIYLPHNLSLLILETNGQVFKQVTSREADNWIQLEFRGQLNEDFQVKIQLGEVSATEDIAISSFINSIPSSKVAATIINSRNCIKIPVFPEPWVMGKNIAQELGVDLSIGRHKINESDLEDFWGRPIHILSHALVLIIYLGPVDKNNTRSIKLRLYPQDRQDCLPVGIKLLGRPLNSTSSYKEKVAKSDRAYIGISFHRPIDEEFVIEVQLGDNFIQEVMI